VFSDGHGGDQGDAGGSVDTMEVPDVGANWYACSDVDVVVCCTLTTLMLSPLGCCSCSRARLASIGLNTSGPIESG